MTTISLDFSKGKINRFEQGTKRVTACQTYEGNTRIVTVYYYDTEFDNSAVPSCCHAPSRCKTDEGAVRMINRFFAAKHWFDF